MTSPDVIELYAGCSRRLRLGELGIGALAAGGILLAGATTASTAVWLCLLGSVHWGISRMGFRDRNSGRLMLRADGSASLMRDRTSVHLQRGAAHFCSRILCVLTLREVLSGRRIRLLICPTRNSQDDYRRLQILLRVAAGSRLNDSVLWL